MATVNIWLPFPNFALSAKVLSTEDLRRQSRNIVKVLNSLHQIGDPHLFSLPVTNMWRGSEAQLAEYGLVGCDEYESRNRGCMAVRKKLTKHLEAASSGELLKPSWFGDVDLHVSHQSGLVRHDPTYYVAFFPYVRADVDLVWPS